ncbi:Epididymal secretory protein E1 [Zootermopsis nevadensis]|uniref:Epididymal secretory protein E1 n=1 Tax=Zootermopsis nevadensis TaxID=136037 RepID=A0A067RDD4_ZOONE|nr:Epididymal secretory protein E1 [Zootermopsis nevadensis]
MIISPGSDKEPPPENLRVSDCTEEPCNFVRGKELIAEVDFVPDHNITELKPNVQAIALGLPVEYPVPQRNACKSILEKTCPLPQNVQATYVLKIPILSIYPPVTAKSYNAATRTAQSRRVETAQNSQHSKNSIALLLRKILPICRNLSDNTHVRLTVKFALIDSGTNQVVTCFKISGQVV